MIEPPVVKNVLVQVIVFLNRPQEDRLKTDRQIEQEFQGKSFPPSVLLVSGLPQSRTVSVGDVLVVTGLFGRCWDLFSSVRLMPHRALDVDRSCDTNRHETESLHRNVDGVCDIYETTGPQLCRYGMHPSLSLQV